MRTILTLLFLPIAIVLVGMISFGEIIGCIIVAITVFALCTKRNK